MLIDTHAHIYTEYYEDIETVLTKSFEHGINYIISSGVNHKTNTELIDLASDYKNLYITLGIHPESADDYLDSDITFIEKNINNPKVVAIGEIGLDYHYEGYDKQKQIDLFKKQLTIAEKNHIPVVIHSREATQDTIDILKKFSVKGVIHSFSGSYEVAKEYIKMGYKLSINGIVTFKNAHIKDIVKRIGIENFVLETDSPYLTPVPFRGKTNFPGNIKYIAQFLETHLDLSLEEISNLTNANVEHIFDKFKY